MSASVGIPPAVITTGGHNLIGGLNRVIHCNYYNAYLQMTVLLTQGIGEHNPESLLTDSVTPLIRLLKQSGYTHEDLLYEFSYCGFGFLQKIDENTWKTASSHYSEITCVLGQGKKSCFFTSGYLQGMLDKTVTEIACKRQGNKSDQFTVLDEPLNVKNYLCQNFELQTNIPERFSFEGCQAFNTRIDEEKIIATVQTLPLYGKYGKGESGLIKIFDAVLTNQFADYYNRISYESYFTLQKAGVPEEENKEMFIQAGHICAFNTFGRIMISSEWSELVIPMCDNKEDWFHGMIAVINSLGWGVYRLEKLDPTNETIIRVYNSYEGVGYRRMYPQANDKNLSFLAMGAILGLIHLFWKIDIRDTPPLTQEFYVNQFNNPSDSYTIEQTAAIAAGDEYDCFVVSK